MHPRRRHRDCGRHQPHGGGAVRRARRGGVGPHRQARAAHRTARRRGLQGLAIAEPDLRRLADPSPGPPLRAGGAGRRRDRRHDRVRGCRIHARRAIPAGAHNPAGPGGFVGGRQDGRQPSAGQEHDRRVLPARGGGNRHGRAQYLAGARSVRGSGRSDQVRPDPGSGLLDLVRRQRAAAARSGPGGDCLRHPPPACAPS
ncbi:hypothetical protein G6F22_017903 [Rhizopus arrhizus]|nr:hypothetical protein G6F22_017903 [Rhizopus arrhizus]